MNVFHIIPANAKKVLEKESQTLEFKQSLHLDGKGHKAMFDKAIVRTYISFRNSQGGTLMCGVHDSGKVMGCPIKSGDLDKCELNLRNKCR